MFKLPSVTAAVTALVRRQRGGWLAWACVAGLALSGTVAAEDVPIDPWTDADWRAGLAGLKPGEVRALRWTERLYQPGGSEPVLVAQRSHQLAFDEHGRLSRLLSERQRRGERDESQQLRYQWGADGQLQRVDDVTAGQALWQRQRDAAGRVAIEIERHGALLRRTTIKYDAAGREVERLVDAGTGAGRVRERRSYHPGGPLKSIDTDSKGGPTRSITFDLQGRPTKVTERSAQALRVTQIRYPAPLVAVHDDSGASLARGGLRKYTREVTFRVRQADELLVVGEPAQPLSRREVRDGRVLETHNEFDDAGRLVLQRASDGARVRCVTEWQYHASGVPSGSRGRQPGGELRCAETPDLDVEIEVDAAGHWVRQVQHLTHADGRRERVAEHTREIEYR